MLIESLKLLDSDGIPIVFCLDALLNEEKLSMQFDHNFKVQTVSSSEKELFRFGWDKVWNTRVCKYRYTINESGVEASSKMGDTSMSVLISDKKLKKGTGTHKFRIMFIQTGYSFADIVNPRDIVVKSNATNFGSNFMLVSLFDDSWVDAQEFRFVLNIYDMQAEINEKKVAITQDEIFIGVSMKHLGLRATIYFD